MKPTVSIICITYNQEKFIGKALEGFMLQETKFPFEVLVHDDASTDDTKRIIDEYVTKYPHIFKTFYEVENQYSKGTFEFVNDMFRASQGEFIAMCEGDDYWTDSKKLQRQVDFLKKHNEYSLCFHDVNIHYEDGSKKDANGSSSNAFRSFTVANLLKDNFIYTCSVMYRAKDYRSLVNSVLPQDLYLHLFHLKTGKIGWIKGVMATYRKQADGVWWESGDKMNSIYAKYRFQLTNLFSVLLNMFGDDKTCVNIINDHLNYLLKSFISIDKTKKTKLFAETAKDFPELVTRYAMQQQEYIDELEAERSRLKRLSDDHASELRDIKNSKWYRLHPKRIAQYVRSDKSKK